MEHSTFERTTHCGRVVLIPAPDHPSLRISGSPGKDVTAGIAELVSCGQRTCPPCAAKIAAHKAAEIAGVLKVHRDTQYYPDELPGVGGGALLVTFTVQHHR